MNPNNEIYGVTKEAEEILNGKKEPGYIGDKLTYFCYGWLSAWLVIIAFILIIDYWK